MELKKFTSRLRVILLSVVLITGISLVPTLQIGVQGQGQQHRTTPATSPTPTTPPTSTATTSFTTPQSTTTTITSPPPADTTTALRPTTITTTPSLDAVGEAANQTEDGAVNQGAMVMIPQSTMEMIMSNVQDAMTSVDSDNMEEAMMALESLDQELKSAANAAGMSVETTPDGGDTSGDGDDDDGADTAE
jgi:hypothetical protein